MYAIPLNRVVKLVLCIGFLVQFQRTESKYERSIAATSTVFTVHYLPNSRIEVWNQTRPQKIPDHCKHCLRNYSNIARSCHVGTRFRQEELNDVWLNGGYIDNRLVKLRNAAILTLVAQALVIIGLLWFGRTQATNTSLINPMLDVFEKTSKGVSSYLHTQVQSHHSSTTTSKSSPAEDLTGGDSKSGTIINKLLHLAEQENTARWSTTNDVIDANLEDNRWTEYDYNGDCDIGSCDSGWLADGRGSTKKDQQFEEPQQAIMGPTVATSEQHARVNLCLLFAPFESPRHNEGADSWSESHESASSSEIIIVGPTQLPDRTQKTTNNTDRKSFDIISESGRQEWRQYMRMRFENSTCGVQKAMESSSQVLPIRYSEVATSDRNNKPLKRVLVIGRGWVALKQLQTEAMAYGNDAFVRKRGCS